MRSYLVFVAAGMLAMTGCKDNQPASLQHGRVNADVPSLPVSFNTADKSINSNQNMLVAAKKVIDAVPGSLWMLALPTSADTLTKSPYSYLGKACKVKGKIFKVEELPPSLGLPGKWSEILMLVRNQNSAVGATTIDYIYKGDVSEINPGQVVICTGFFLGTYESPNAMGGTVEALAILGDQVSRK